MCYLLERDDGPYHALGEQSLAHRVVDLVRPGVVEILALEVDVRGAVVLRQTLSEVQGVGTTDVILEDAVEFSLLCVMCYVLCVVC